MKLSSDCLSAHRVRAKTWCQATKTRSGTALGDCRRVASVSRGNGFASASSATFSPSSARSHDEITGSLPDTPVMADSPLLSSPFLPSSFSSRFAHNTTRSFPEYQIRLACSEFIALVASPAGREVGDYQRGCNATKRTGGACVHRDFSFAIRSISAKESKAPSALNMTTSKAGRIGIVSDSPPKQTDGSGLPKRSRPDARGLRIPAVRPPPRQGLLLFGKDDFILLLGRETLGRIVEAGSQALARLAVTGTAQD